MAVGLLLVAGTDSFLVSQGPRVRLDSRLFGRVKKGELKKEIAGIGRDKDSFPDADKGKKKPQGAGRMVDAEMKGGSSEENAELQEAMDEVDAAKSTMA